MFMMMVRLRTVISESDDNDSDNNHNDDICDIQQTCQDCIKLPQCVYCIDANYTKDKNRCMSR